MDNKPYDNILDIVAVTITKHGLQLRVTDETIEESQWDVNMASRVRDGANNQCGLISET